MSGRGKSGDIGPLRPAILLASAIFHAVLFAYLAHYVAQPPDHDEAPSIQVSLVPQSKPSLTHRHTADPRRPNDREPSARTAPEQPIASAASSRASDNIAPSAPSGAEAGQDEAMAGVRRALRGLKCDREQLSREEQEQCETQRWARAAPVTARLNLDPTGRFAKNPEPFLSRRPKKGCRLRLTGDVDAMGDDMNSRAGITCVKRF